MSEALVNGPDIRAPDADGAVVLFPSGTAPGRIAIANQRMLALCEERIQNIPLRHLRTEVRAMSAWAGAPAVVATGHQIELYHPGVWVKNLVIQTIAKHIGGQALHLAVDTDAPKHLHLRWPGGGMPISDDPAISGADWLGLVKAPRVGHMEALVEAFLAASASWPFEPAMAKPLKDTAAQPQHSGLLSRYILDLASKIDRQIGTELPTVVASEMWSSRPFLALACHVMARADSFAAAYNAALANYRRRRGIKRSGVPWPDLRVESERCEVPFWLDDLSAGCRRRAVVARTASGWALEHGPEQHLLRTADDGLSAAESLGAFLAACGLRLSPRAMMLTTFMRLLGSDLFVHGIGGAMYDRVTDEVIARWFKIEPPPFAVATATLYFPTSDSARRIDLGQLAIEGRRLRHGWADPVKRDMAHRIAQAPRLSAERRRMFDAMHAYLAGRREGEAFRRWLEHFEECRRLHEHQKAVFDRELFYGLQPAGRLCAIRERVEQMTHGGEGLMREMTL